ncbi:hypothetical protein ADK41_33360 [Streptomyces caelestis]|uniref:DUF6571 domain-containing protein n=1 Tax=Streptomyces caelestis TaxID=36816 RepID=A0A0M8QK71_9ACTN|nr:MULTISPECIES: DUF6571 family protein [Streptomyces]KOT30047.1 hypothetical protein ADK41_33360 [Streptomyces caelestis]KOV21100.1 hypothetical protein ADK58_32715 [Streptomyces sp. XY152]
MDLDALRHANLKLLDDAVEDWSIIVRNLNTLAEDAEKGLHQAANKAKWSGKNAGVSKEFIGKTAGEIKDAHTQAKSIHGVLKDTAGELKSYRTQLKDAIDRGLKKNLTVMDTGDGGFTVTMNVHPDRAAEGYTPPSHTQSDVNALRDEIQGILGKATESDDSASKVLKALADQTNYGFGDASYQDRDAAAEALKTADELAALAKKDPEKLSTAEFDRLNAGLKKYSADPLFAERFATTLGPRKTLDFWTGITDPHTGWDLRHDRREQFDDLQKNLSLTLASATQSDSAAMTSWKGNMVALVDQPVGRGGGFPLGGQVMSNLMRWGDYDDRFLNSYGDKLMATEKKFTGNGQHGAWQRLGPDAILNHTGTDSGWDPMTGYLKALANNPDAATSFFNDTFLTKDEDHDFTEKKDDKEVKRSLTNFDYLFEERHWPTDFDSEHEESIAGRNNLAMALEAATTGHPAGEQPTLDTPHHNAEQTKLMERLVSSIGEDPDERLLKHRHMLDSVGQITSEYLPDISRSFSDADRNDPDSTSWERTQKMYPIYGEEAVLDPRDVTKLLFTVGQSPDGYAAVEIGQKAYMSQLMEHHLDPDLPADQVVDDDTEGVVRQIANKSGEVSGILALGRQEELAGANKERDEEYKDSMDLVKSSISGGLGTAVGVGTSFVATPWVGALAGGATSTVTGTVLESVFQDFKSTELEDSEDARGELWQKSYENNGNRSGQAARLAAEEHGMVDPADAETWARDSGRQGFYNAQAIVDGRAPGSRTTS